MTKLTILTPLEMNKQFEILPQPLTINILYTVHVSIPLHMFSLMYTHTETPQLQP